MFTINFKREFVRCCCCLKTSWKRHKLQRLTGKFQTSTGVQRGPLSHTASNNSGRSLPGTNVVKFFDDAAICENGGSPVLSRDLLKPKLDTGSRRANVNNFMKVNLPALEKPWRWTNTELELKYVDVMLFVDKYNKTGVIIMECLLYSCKILNKDTNKIKIRLLWVIVVIIR